jgi:uncharacterized RDD family membrane protein YckC
MQFVKPNFGRVIAAGLIDGLLYMGLIFFLIDSVSLPEKERTILMLSFPYSFIVYRFIAILLFRGTPGMRILNLVFLNAEEEETDFTEKLLASFFILYRGVDSYQEDRSYA